MISAGTKRQQLLLKFAFVCLFSIHTRAHILLFLLQSVKNIFFHKKKIGIHTAHPADHRVNEIFYLFGPVVFHAIRFTQGFCLLKLTSRGQKTKDSPLTDFSIILQRHTAVTQYSMVIFTQATSCSKQDQFTLKYINEPTDTYNTRCPSSSINPSFKGNIYVNS